MSKTNTTHAIGHRSCAWMTADHDRALLLLSAGEPVRIADLRAHMGAFAPRMVRALSDLTKRNVAAFYDGAYHLDVR